MDSLRQMKYAAVSAIELACRVAILGSAMVSIAYGKNDEAILLIDKVGSIPAVLRIEVRTLIEYAQLVQKQKQYVSYSSEVRACIDYFAAHTHNVIALDELAECTAYSKEYLAKLLERRLARRCATISFRLASTKPRHFFPRVRAAGRLLT